MATLWELFVKISGDNSSYKKSVSEANIATEKLGSTFASVDKKLAAAIGFASIGAGALAAASKFEEAYVQIQRSTGATEERMKKLEESFTNVYKQTGASSEKIAEVLSMLSTRTQATGKDLEDLTLKTLKLAKTQREDVSAIVPLVTRAFGDWSISTAKQGNAMDYLRVTSQNTGTQISKLSETVVYAGAPLRQLGYNFEQATALIGKFEKEGVNTELVLGGMKAALQKFARDGVTDTAKAWQEFVDGVRSGSITLQDVMNEVGAKRGVDLYKAITEGRFEIDKMVVSLKELSQDGGSSIKTLQEKMKVWQHQIESLVVAHKDLIVTIGLTTPAVVSLGGFIAGLIKNASSIGPALGALLSNPMLLLGASGTAAIGFGFSQLIQDLKNLRSLDAAFSGFIAKQIEGARTAEQLATAEKNVNESLQNGLISKEESAKAMKMLSDREAEMIRKQFSLGLAIDKPGASKATAGGPIEPVEDRFSKGRTVESYSLQVLFGQYHAAVAAKKALVDSTVEELEAERKSIEALQALGVSLSEATQLTAMWREDQMYSSSAVMEMGRSIETTLNPVNDAHAAIERLSKITEELGEASIQAGVDILRSSPWAKLESGLEALGVRSDKTYQQIADTAAQAYSDILESGQASKREETEAWAVAAKAQAQYMLGLGEITRDEYESIVADIEDQLGALGIFKEHQITQHRRDIYALGKELESMSHRLFSDMERDIAKDIVSWRGWADSIISIGKNLAEDFLGIMLKGLFKPLEDKFASLAVTAGDWLSGLFGGGSSTVTSTVSGSKSAGAGSTALGSKGASGAVGGLAGTITAVASVGSLISGVIGNFQSARQETTLNAIEHEARYSQIHLLGILEKLNQYVPGIKDIHDYLYEHQIQALASINESIRAAWSGAKAPSGAGVSQNGVYINELHVTSSVTAEDLDRVMGLIFTRMGAQGVA
ncbi:MAG: phage tail tape measure protein [Spirochaetaceae bacterium]|nr:phage tail tape measure protein [Spirochaetaceae bacterium]